MKKLWLFAAGVSLVGVTIFGTLWTVRQPEKVAAVTSTPSDSSQTIAALNRRLEALERNRLVAGRAAPSTKESPKPSAGAPSTSSDVSHQHHPPTTETLDRRVTTESRDRSWADGYEHDLAASFAEKFPNDHIRQATCATSVCKIVVEHTSAENQRAFSSYFGPALPEGIAMWHVQSNGDGENTTVIHLIRRGYQDSFTDND